MFRSITEAMGIKKRSSLSRKRNLRRGFTLMEVLIIIAVMCILGAIAAPSFATLINGIAVQKTVAAIQAALQDTQRQAIRTSHACTVQLVNVNGNTIQPSLSGNCLTSGTPTLDANVKLATNIQPILSSPSPPNPQTIAISYGIRGGAEFSVFSAVQAPLLPNDPTGKIVASVSNPSIPRQCVAVSSIMGLTRVGTYTGSIDPKDITDIGVCTAKNWTMQ